MCQTAQSKTELCALFMRTLCVEASTIYIYRYDKSTYLGFPKWIYFFLNHFPSFLFSQVIYDLQLFLALRVMHH